MNDELKSIQIEIEKVKLEREVLALKRELKQQQRSEAVFQAGADTAHIASNVVNKTGSVLMYLFLFICGFVTVFLTLSLIYAIKDNQHVGGDFGYKMGWYLIQDFWIKTFGGVFAGVYMANIYRDHKNGVVEPVHSEPAFSRTGRIVISLLLCFIGLAIGSLAFVSGHTLRSFFVLTAILGVIFFLAWLSWPKRYHHVKYWKD